ncbi:MAG: general secretion pathway protein GspB [Chromatiales bacterium]|nr:general secretion pathway protein GspB [Chromatiales bacterium]
MSFILDALRKSDAERQRGAAPTLADVRYAAGRRQRNIWIPLLVVVLVANIGFMAWQWNAGRNQSPPPASVEAVPAPTPSAAPVVAPAAVPEVRALARETAPLAPVAPPEVESDLPAGELAKAEPAVPAEVSAPLPAAEPPAKTSRIIADPALPTLDQLLGAGTLDLPALNLDLLVYNDSPSVRFAVINGRKYREGTQLTEGPTLESITPEGVILASQGQRFMLDRK